LLAIVGPLSKFSWGPFEVSGVPETGGYSIRLVGPHKICGVPLSIAAEVNASHHFLKMVATPSNCGDPLKGSLPN
jgi:hypothetical protein